MDDEFSYAPAGDLGELPGLKPSSEEDEKPQAEARAYSEEASRLSVESYTVLSAAFRVWRRYPILWLPVFVADWSRYGLEQLFPYVRFWLIELWPKQHSVLTGQEEFSGAYEGSFVATVALLRFCVSILECFLWCSAFELIAASIRAKGSDVSIRWEDGRLWLFRHIRRALLFSAAAFIVFALFAALLGLLSLTLLSAHFPGHARSHTITLWLGIVWLAVFAGCAAPLALKLLMGGVAISSRQRRLAAICAVFAVVVSQAVFAASRSVTFEPHTPLQMNLFFLLVSTLAALPYVPLFIALSLLSQSRDETNAPVVLEA